MRVLRSLLGLMLGSCFVAAYANAESPSGASTKPRHVTAADVFDVKQVIMFQDDFSSPANTFKRWGISEDDRYGLNKANADRLAIVDAPDLAANKAVRFFVNRAPNIFRSELSLPSENGWNERWYAEQIMLPKGWVIDPAKARTIVMQWHGIPGNFRATFPNLDIAVQMDKWLITRSFGDPKTKPTRDVTPIDGSIEPGKWASWIIHAKWSPEETGLLQIWKDGKLIYERHGPNVYGTIGVNYTPYIKTGIYNPFWHVSGDASRNDDESRKAFDTETATTSVKNKTVYIENFKMGNEHATYADVDPTDHMPLKD